MGDAVCAVGGECVYWYVGFYMIALDLLVLLSPPLSVHVLRDHLDTDDPRRKGAPD